MIVLFPDFITFDEQTFQLTNLNLSVFFKPRNLFSSPAKNYMRFVYIYLFTNYIAMFSVKHIICFYEMYIFLY